MSKKYNKLDTYTKALAVSCDNLIDLIHDYWDIIPNREKVELAKRLDTIQDTIDIAVKKLVEKGGK
tara:strand:+ start:746 stop:943 length:198 start_codon:yes stop_codon:yes gene_type:complete